jgi:DNA (cytosine-5)-methyltransferase 1
VSATLGVNCGDSTGRNGVIERRGLDAVTPYTLKIRSGCEGGGKGALIQTDKSATLATNNDQYLFQPVYCLQGNGIDRADTAGCNGAGWREGQSYTLNTIDRPAVAYLASGKDTVGTLMANAGTKLWLGNQEAFSGDYHIIEEKGIQYIVRRLTPTECARLQGFADQWGHIEKKRELTPHEYVFWLRVRKTHAVINGKKVQDYTKEQILTWYNKLHTDGAEYKMWGNGIALPPALYCMQGIVDAMNKEEGEEEWLL